MNLVKLVGVLAVGVGIAAVGTSAQAMTFYSDPAAFTGGGAYSFPVFTGSNVDPNINGGDGGIQGAFGNFTAPQTVGGVTYDTLNNQLNGDGADYLASYLPNPYASTAFGTLNTGDVLVIELPTAVSTYASYIYDTTGNDNIQVSAYDSNGGLLGTLYTLTNVSTGGTPSFFGLQDTTANISSIQISTVTGSVLLSNTDPVPEPATIAILGFGVLGIVVARRRLA